MDEQIKKFIMYLALDEKVSVNRETKKFILITDNGFFQFSLDELYNKWKDGRKSA